MMKFSKLLVLGSMAAVVVAFMSCSKTEDLFDSDSYVAQLKSAYDANFVKKYGPVAPNKSWDMSTKQSMYSLSSMSDASTATTRGTEPYTRTEEPGFSIEQDVLTWFFQNTPAGQNNSAQGNPFYLTISEEEFTIVPVFQGNAKKYWQLWMHVEGLANDVMIWEKGDDLSYRKEENGQLIEVGKGQPGIPKDAYEVVAPAITFSGMPTAKMNFYLRAWNTYEAYTNDTDKNQYTVLSSLAQKMLALNCPKPNNVPDNVSYRIIGCEDWTDNDYEDLAFLIYGNFTLTEAEDVYEVIPKRYMVEDLGASDDFDFNDVVVDVYDELKTTYTYSITDGVKTLTDVSEPVRTKQWAVVRAAGGTIDFTIKIGSTTWKKSDHVTPYTEMKNTGRDGAINYQGQIDKFDIKKMDWSPADDNISIEVDGKDGYTGVYYIPFPKDGEIPMIIAVDTSVHWMFERLSVPDSWIVNSPNNNQGN